MRPWDAKPSVGYAEWMVGPEKAGDKVDVAATGIDRCRVLRLIHCQSQEGNVLGSR
jgi:hypothetical protein